MSLVPYLEQLKKEAALCEYRFSFHGIVFCVHSAEESLKSHIEEWLWPHLTPCDDPCSDYTFYAVNERLPFQTIDEERHSIDGSGDIYSITINPETQGQTIRSLHQNEALILNCSKEMLFADILQSIRQFTAYRLRLQGFSLLNASAVFYNDKTYLIAGRSGSGKTALALAAVDHGALYMANDVVIVRSWEDRLIISGGMDDIGFFQPGLPTKALFSHKDYFNADTEKLVLEMIDVDCIVFPQVHTEANIPSSSYISEEIGLNLFSEIYGTQQTSPFMPNHPLLNFITVDFSYDRATDAVQQLFNLRQTQTVVCSR